MCVWAYGTIYSLRPGTDLYQYSVAAVFAAIPILCTIAESPLQILLERLLVSLLERPLERLLERLLESLLDSLLDSLLESLLERASHREE
jgi:hypothetical protein